MNLISNKYIICSDGTIDIEVDQNLYAKIDIIDMDILLQYHWYLDKYHIITNEDSTRIYMDRLIVSRMNDNHANYIAKHINGNTLDNRRCNLYPISHQRYKILSKTPCNNTSGIRGVSWDKDNRKYICYRYIDHFVRFGVHRRA
jgi:hypothetical protein